MIRQRLTRLEALQPKPLTEQELAKRVNALALRTWFHHAVHMPKYKPDPSLPPEAAHYQSFQAFIADFDPANAASWASKASHD